MSTSKIVYVSDDTHRRLKMLAVQRSRTMGELVGDFVLPSKLAERVPHAAEDVFEGRPPPYVTAALFQ